MRAAIAGVCLFALSGSAGAQSLGEVARREQDRRGSSTREPARTYTEEDLASQRPAEPEAQSADEPSAASAAGVAGSSPATEPPHGAELADGPPAEPVRRPLPKASRGAVPDDFAARRAAEESWHARADQQRLRIRMAEGRLRALEQGMAWEVGTLVRSCSGRQTARRTRIANRAQEIEQAKAEVAGERQALEDLEEEARRSFVPPGWLRER